MPSSPLMSDPPPSPEDVHGDTALLDRTRIHLRRTTHRLGWQAGALSALGAGGVSALAGQPHAALGATVLLVCGPLLLAAVLRFRVVNLVAAATRVRRRRLLIRWLPRLFLIVSLPGWATASIAWWNILAVGLTASGLCVATGLWCQRQLRREHEGVPVALGERALLLLLAAGTAVAVLSVLGTAGFVAWSIHHALSGLPTPPP